MKLCIVLFAMCALIAAVSAVPVAARQQLMYFQQHRPMSRFAGGQQQALLVHRYNAPKYANRRSSEQEVGAFASGDSIEGATYIEDEPVLQDGDAFSVAEAYPAEADDASALVAAEEDEPAIAGVENDVYQPIENDEYPLADAAPAPVAPQADTPVARPPKKTSNKKKAPAKAPVAAAEESDDGDFVPSVTKSGGAPHNFFPMNFGNTSGGSIAVANSFSTGKGSAASHAVAYGSSSSTSSKKRRRND